MPAAIKNVEYLYSVENGTDCWLWRGVRNVGGYGTARGGDRKTLAHRLVYEFHVGEIPSGLQLDHLCRVRACVNPEHLEPVTMAENIRRGRGGAHQAAKTHCPAGHAYDAANTRVYQGRRFCRACQWKDNRAAAARRKAVAA